MKLTGPVGPQGYKVTSRAPSPSENPRVPEYHGIVNANGEPASYNDIWPSTDKLPNFEAHPEYQQLPECIKSTLSAKEYAWMPQESKRTLMADMTTPEVGEDD